LRVLPEVLGQELNFMDSFSEDNPKNYQIWYHRRAVVELIGNADSEKTFCDRVFSVDAKNYHAWAHRYVFAFECICVYMKCNCCYCAVNGPSRHITCGMGSSLS
jgi:hypothetical protein